MLCVLVSLIVVILSYFLLKQAFGSLSLGSFLPHTYMWYFQLLICSVVGINIIYLGLWENRVTGFYADGNSLLFSLIAVLYSVLMLSLFSAVLCRAYHIDRAAVDCYIEAQPSSADTRNMRVMMVGMVVLGVLVVGYLCLRKAPLFMLLTGRLSGVLQARVAYSRNFAGSLLIKNVIGQSILCTVAYVAYAYYLIEKTKFWRNIFIFMLGISLFIAGASLSKSGMAMQLLPMVFIYILIRGKVNVKKLMVFGIPVCAVIVIFYLVQRGSAYDRWYQVLLDFENGPLGRVTAVQIQSLPAYFRIFPNVHPFTYGRGIAVVRFLGIDMIESARVVASILEPVGVANGTSGVANTLYVADAYANFGWAGVLFSPMLAAFWICYFYKRLLRAEKNAINIGCYVAILFGLVSGLTGGFCAAYIVNTRVIAIVLLQVLLLTFLEKKRASDEPGTAADGADPPMTIPLSKGRKNVYRRWGGRSMNRGMDKQIWK